MPRGPSISGNVIYGNGEGIIFSGNETVAASDSVVTHNVIVGAQIRRNVESYYPAGAPHGTDNLVQGNCTFGGPSSYYAGPANSGIQQPEVGFSSSGNVVANPTFVDPGAGNFQLASGSACAAVLGPTEDGRLPGLPNGTPAPVPTPSPAPAAATTSTAAPASASVPQSSEGGTGRRGRVFAKLVHSAGGGRSAVAVLGRATVFSPRPAARVFARGDRGWVQVASAPIDTGSGSFRAVVRLSRQGSPTDLQVRVPGASASRVLRVPAA